MPKIICALENASTEINGIKFIVGEDGRLISEADVAEPHFSTFLSIPGYFVDGADAIEDGDKKDPEPAKTTAPKTETAAQRKARLKAEQEAAEKAEAEKAEAERLAAEEAPRKAEEEAAKQNEGGEGDNGAGTGEQETVF